MAVSIRDYQLVNNTHRLYDVTFYTDQIHILLTHSPHLVDQWLAVTHQIHRRNPSNNTSTVGLDVEWRPNFNRSVENPPIAVLQLCVGNRCLIFQILHSPYIPQSLTDFLRNQNGDFVFVGVGIENDAAKLWKDYGLTVGNTVDLRGLAVEKSYDGPYQNGGLKELTWRVLGKQIEKPRSVTLSPWDNRILAPCQIQGVVNFPLSLHHDSRCKDDVFSHVT